MYYNLFNRFQTCGLNDYIIDSLEAEISHQLLDTKILHSVTVRLLGFPKLLNYCQRLSADDWADGLTSSLSNLSLTSNSVDNSTNANMLESWGDDLKNSCTFSDNDYLKDNDYSLSFAPDFYNTSKKERTTEVVTDSAKVFINNINFKVKLRIKMFICT